LRSSKKARADWVLVVSASSLAISSRYFSKSARCGKRGSRCRNLLDLAAAGAQPFARVGEVVAGESGLALLLEARQVAPGGIERALDVEQVEVGKHLLPRAVQIAQRKEAGGGEGQQEDGIRKEDLGGNAEPHRVGLRYHVPPRLGHCGASDAGNRLTQSGQTLTD
jgi:hypothetical protein